MNMYPNLNDGSIFKFDKLESMFCNNCGHTANVNGICIDLSLHFEYRSNVQTISGIYHYLMDPIEEYSENCRCDVCQRLSTLSGALVLQLNIVKYVGGIIKKVICNLSIDEEIIFKEILVKNFVTS